MIRSMRLAAPTPPRCNTSMLDEYRRRDCGPAAESGEIALATFGDNRGRSPGKTGSPPRSTGDPLGGATLEP
jgi:hypothetical protein